MADSGTLLAFKAGRAFRREGTNFVDPSPAKGAILLRREDDLLHLMWKNRTSNEVEEDLILFPSDATFLKVSQAPGRVYVLKFSSSNQRHFFWMQDASSVRDEEFVNNVNGFLMDPDYEASWGSSSQPSTSTSTAGASQSSAPSNFQATPEQLAQLQQLLTSAVGSGAAPPSNVSLNDILTPANITPLFTSHPDLIPTLFPHLPPDLPMPPSPEVLQRIISSPQFRSAVSSFDQALRTGLLGGLVRGLGLPEEAGTGIEPSSQKATLWMEIHMKNIELSLTKYDVTRHLAHIFHGPGYLDPQEEPINFEVYLYDHNRLGRGALTLPNISIATQFLQEYGQQEDGLAPPKSCVVGQQRIRFAESYNEPRSDIIEKITRLPFQDPSVAEGEENRSFHLQSHNDRYFISIYGIPLPSKPEADLCHLTLVLRLFVSFADQQPIYLSFDDFSVLLKFVP
ncbi:adhesion regulating molecule [Lentinula edodes]|uniref:Adhesion regulating molecule n=1 Tax=Lentinula edodes TaxID=5353 RepID=A0A1Q3EEZ2_LENED|nr:adhesion regulating molecule [Lentinula edodes]